MKKVLHREHDSFCPQGFMTLSVQILIDQARDGCMHAASKRGQKRDKDMMVRARLLAISLLYLLYESFIFSSMN
jgi:hypothetical protein